MKKTFLTILSIFGLSQINAQFTADKAPTEDIQNSKTIESLIIKKGVDHIVIKNNKVNFQVNFQVNFHKLNDKKVYVFDKELKANEVNFPFEELKNLDKGKQAIDKAPIYIETFYSDNYKNKQMFYSNQKIEDLFSILRKKYNPEINNFINDLPSGEYTNLLFINRPIKKNKSKFYSVIEKELIKNGLISEDIYHQPLIYINKVKSTFDDLNKLEESNVKSYRILNDEIIKSLYGTSGLYGIVEIELK